MNILDEFFSLMESGGPIMWVILLVAILATGLLCWQGLFVNQLMGSAKRDYQNLVCDKSFIPTETIAYPSSPIAQLVEKINWADVESKEELVKEMNIHISDIVPKMKNILSTIGILGSLLPMLGLLGTVTGMINVFEVIAIQGSGDADALAGGISQALLTTASGLIIAIPVIFFHHLLANRISALMDVTAQAMQVVAHRDISLYRGAILHVHNA